MRIGILLLCGLVLPRFAAAQYAKQPPTKPLLRIETGMHTASIRQIGMDAAQKYLVSASLDKTVRVWDRATGKLLLTLRPPIGAGDEGKVYAVAISPDGQTVACAGRTGYTWDKSVCIYCFDRASGQMVHRITGLPQVILRLAYSADGKYLAAVLGGKNGLRVYRTSDYQQVAEDKGYGDSAYGLDWDKNGRIVTACYDGFIRLYSADFTLHRKVKVLDGTQPYWIRFSPDGSLITVGYYETPYISVVSGDSLSLMFSPDTANVDNGYLSSVCWSADGSQLYAAGTYQKNGDRQIRCWQNGGKGAATDWPAAHDALFDLLPLREDGVAFASGEPTLGLLNGSGKLLWKQIAPTADNNDCLEHFLLSGDGATVQFGFETFGKQPARYDVAAHRLDTRPPDDGASGSLHPPRIAATGLTITDWQNNDAPKRNGKALPLKQYETSRSLAIAPDAQHFLLGADWWVRCFNRDGKEVWNAPAPGVAWSVNVAGNGKLAVAAFGDGTLHWYRMRDGAELLALFPHADKKRWVAWTPSGYYDCSVGGEDLIGWHINNGKDAAADFYPGSRFHDTLYRPDVIARVLTTLDEHDALKEADAAIGQKTQAVDVAKQLTPILTIHSSDESIATGDPKVTIRYMLRAPSGEPVTGLRVLIDGERREPTARSLPHIPKSAGEVVTGEIEVAVPPRDCEIDLIAENRFAGSEKGIVHVSWRGKPAENVEKPLLYIFASGVDRYADSALTLHYAAKDAADFVAVMQAQKGLLYKDVVVKLLRDSEVTRGSVLTGLTEIQAIAKPDDLVMVFMSGHGDNDSKGHYYYVPSDCAFATLVTQGVEWNSFTEKMKDMGCKALLFLDTCHAANVVGSEKKGGSGTDTTAIINEFKNAGIGTMVFAACQSGESSLEDAKWENGAFTKILVEGLSGKADTQHTGRVTVAMLNAYLSEQVPVLTDKRQHPVATFLDAQSSTSDFPLAVVK